MDAERAANSFTNRLGMPITQREWVLDVTAQDVTDQIVDPPNGTEKRG